MVPAEHHKQLKNIYKASERAKRKKQQRANGDDDDDGTGVYDDMTTASAPRVIVTVVV